MKNFYHLGNQASMNIKLFSQFISTFADHAAQWAEYQDRISLSGSSSDYLDHESYDAMVKMGPAAVLLIMNKYTEEQSGWWHEMLDEIVHGRDEL
jgi:hypothetical protein